MVFDFWRKTMLSKLGSVARAGLLALSVAGGLSVSAAATPGGMAANPAAEGAGNLIRVQGDGRYSDCMRGGDCWRGRSGGFEGRREFRREWRDGRRWDGNRRWDGDRRWRRGWDDDWGRRYYRRNYYRPRYNTGIYFDFYSPSYRYYEPPRYYQPRRVYRGGGSAHVQWCYNRYRSYRAWDNTYQPYNGPRRQCWSPYS
jgi:hypothetical protein